MKINHTKLQFIAITGVFVFQFMFPHYTNAYILANSSVGDSVLAISNTPQEIMFDSYDNVNKLPLSASREAIRTVKVPMTAYSSTPDQTDDTPFITASGTHVRDGIVAANFLPIGTQVKIPEMYGDKIFVVEDRMNARYHYKMDIWMETRQEAMNFGLRYLEVEIF
jgi:3D (Asp-Asp-Asp) domain-containing protein